MLIISNKLKRLDRLCIQAVRVQAIPGISDRRFPNQPKAAKGELQLIRGNAPMLPLIISRINHKYVSSVAPEMVTPI
jgi:hypothetical protein